MSITQISHSSVFGSGNSLSTDHFTSGNNAAVVVGISYIPLTEISGVTYGGENLTHIASASQSDRAEQSVWYMTNPPTGTNTVEVTFSGSTAGLLNALTFDGVKQTDTIFQSRTGAGSMVKELPIKSFSKVGGISIGLGLTDDEDSYVTSLSPVQVQNWDVVATGLGIHSQAISAQLPVTLDKITVDNVLTKVADWAIVIIGLEGA